MQSILQDPESALTVRTPPPGGAGSWAGRTMLKRWSRAVAGTLNLRTIRPWAHQVAEADNTGMTTRAVEMMGNLFLVDPYALRENARSWAGRGWTAHYLTNDEVMSHPSTRYLTEFEAEVFRVFGPPAPPELPAVPPVITLIHEEAASGPLAL